MTIVVLVSSLLAVLLALLIRTNWFRWAVQALLSRRLPQRKRPEDRPPITPELPSQGMGERTGIREPCGPPWVGKPWRELFLDELPTFDDENEMDRQSDLLDERESRAHQETA